MIFNERFPDWTVSELTAVPVSSAENFPDRTVSELTEFPVSSAENFPDWTVSELTEFPVSSAENFPDRTISELTAFPVSPVKKRFLPLVNNKTTDLSYEPLLLTPAPPHADNSSTSLGGLVAGSNPCAVLGYRVLRQNACLFQSW